VRGVAVQCDNGSRCGFHGQPNYGARGEKREYHVIDIIPFLALLDGLGLASIRKNASSDWAKYARKKPMSMIYELGSFVLLVV
jgi:hypothetical protein